ncbi:hypothetical protein UFOVP128_47 [uncultured Caudovirales phage]|uniref:SprT-like n=1 Tax=uncultured Caudovirales phage TaxID=2100421 RepID=A0A6J7X496_9CAUD|nr:hypothetical protein UFOVP128_47 [uncultured Caudovirales phage]CAB5222103.1 hypothetical protein UFOVP243_72 [uncultured Caudovirales phage]
MEVPTQASPPRDRQRQSSPFMKIPTQFQLAGSTWTVTQIQDYNLLGSCNRDTRQILLKKNVMQEVKEQTFYHELVHAIYYMLGRDEHDEKEVDVIATFLHHFLQTAKY